jgi:isopenicillin-N epimerase
VPDPDLRSLFLLDPDVTFLNHGSFGACPRPVFEVYQQWQREIEREPVDFFSRRASDLLATARADLAEYVGAGADDLVFVPNATHGINIVARSMHLGPGDEVLGNDHEYGACERAWQLLCARQGATYRRVAIDAPVTTHEALVEQVWSQVNERTRVLFLSHVTSSTGLIFPVAELCARARAAGILSLVDGAHGPGQVPVDLAAIGADFYTGNCHKWLCAPKGAAFLHARPERQDLVEPLIISWGRRPEKPGPNRYIDDLEFTGTRDIAPYLSVAAAIAFQRDHDWPAVQARCHALLAETRARLLALPGVTALNPDDPAWYAQMAAVALPPSIGDPLALHERLFAEHRLEVPVYAWNGRPVLRVAIQAYNRRADADALLTVLPGLLGG